MSDSTLYDDDILLWSEQQAEVIRRLGRTGRAPNDLDVENVAEEIESVGRSELAAVKSYLRLILLHLVKLAAEEDATSAAHWRGEIAAFRAELKDRHARSMDARIDLHLLWREVRERIELDPGLVTLGRARLPATCPVELDELTADHFDVDALTSLVRQSLGGGSPAPGLA
jgi:hypothetical protein